MARKRDPKGNLRRAERRARRFSDTRQWCGCFTPCEIFALLEDGARQPDRPKGTYDPLEYIKKQKDAGQNSRHWFYFLPSRAQEERWTKK